MNWLRNALASSVSPRLAAIIALTLRPVRSAKAAAMAASWARSPSSGAACATSVAGDAAVSRKAAMATAGALGQWR